MFDPMHVWVKALLPAVPAVVTISPSTGTPLPVVWLESLGGDGPDRLTLDWVVRAHCFADTAEAAMALAGRVQDVLMNLPGVGAAAHATTGAPAVAADPDTGAVDAAFNCTLTTLRG